MLNSRKNIFYLKIISIFLISFFLTNFLIKEAFIANTPRIRPDVGSNLIAAVQNFLGAPGQFIAQLFRGKPSLEEELKDVPYEQVAKGIYAKEKDNKSIKLYKEGEVEWLTYTFQYKGKTYTIRYAAGDSPPDVELVKKALER